MSDCMTKDTKKDEIEKEKQMLYEYWFANLTGIGRKKKWELLLSYKEEELFWKDKKEWKNLLSIREWNRFCKETKPNNIEETEEEFGRLLPKGIQFISHRHPNYPAKLKRISDAPLALYIKGQLPKEKKTIAIVGSRTPSAYGREMARFFGRELSKRGVGVISGLAAGIDVCAHKGALEAGKPTYGVLGCGVDVIYPRENFLTYEEMLEKGGILSEYKPKEEPMAYRFPERNRIISGLSDGIFIVEARERSGSLITADCGLEQGKDIFALPGRAFDPLSEGCNWLIRQGAKLVTEPAHILEELFPECEKNLKNTNNLDKLLDNKEKIVYDCLGLEPKYVEDILRETNLTVSEGISVLFRLELNGYIEQIVKDYYIVRL